MKITIDLKDGAGARDYTDWVSAEHKPKVLRKLNAPSTLKLGFAADGPEFVVPVQGAVLRLVRNDGVALFTGTVEASPEFEYLGWGERGAAFLYLLEAKSDEVRLDAKATENGLSFVQTAAGDALRELTEHRVAGEFAYATESGPVLPYFESRATRAWSATAAELAGRGRMAYRIHDGTVTLQAIGTSTHTLRETDATFSPEGLRCKRIDSPVNDVTVYGRLEARAHVTDYFLGDGLSLGFRLSQIPFGRNASTLLDAEWDSLAASDWMAQGDPGAVQSAGGRLQVNGSGALQWREQLELGRSLKMQCGDVVFTGASSGVLTGVYGATDQLSDCIAGFRVQPEGGQSRISAVVNGAGAGTSLLTQTGHRYLMTVRMFCREMVRREQLFHSSARGTGNGRGGAANGSGARVVIELHDVDPASAGSQAAASVVLYDGVVASVPAFGRFVPVSLSSGALSMGYARVSAGGDVEVRSTVPGQTTRTRLMGSLSEGAESVLTESNHVVFHSPYVPAPSESLQVRYRSAGRALARVRDEQAMAARAGANDSGMRATAVRMQWPTARTVQDCVHAGKAMLDDSVQNAWVGEYACWSGRLPGGAASDVWPGDAVAVQAPLYGAELNAIVREVEIRTEDLYDDGSEYVIRFANEAAAPIALEYQRMSLSRLPAVTVTEARPADLAEAAMTEMTSTTVRIDAGVDLPAGYGIEVRRSDFGWGVESDRNLLGRFTTRSFTLPRLARVQTYCLRMYDNASTPRYSAYSAVLHMDVPFV